MTEKNLYCKASSVSEEHGIVFGYAIVCKEAGADYFDTQGDHIPEGSMIKASMDFMKNSRLADEMHDFKESGTVVFAFPMTEDIAKAMDIEVKKTGLIIGMAPSPEVLAKFRDGTYTGFSIGGKYIENVEVSDEA